MTRRPDWEQRLCALIAEWQNQPFCWGRYDCGQFALAVLAAVSARDWSQVSVQPYRTARGAQALLKKLNVQDMAQLASLMLGPRIPASYAQRGDLVVCESRFGPALGVCLGSRIAVPGDEGLVCRPLHDAFASWRI